MGQQAAAYPQWNIHSNNIKCIKPKEIHSKVFMLGEKGQKSKVTTSFIYINSGKRKLSEIKIYYIIIKDKAREKEEEITKGHEKT